jgi:hypothetical protein
LRDLIRRITAAAGTIVWHPGIVADLPASNQAKAARCSITLLLVATRVAPTAIPGPRAAGKPARATA